MDEASNLLVVDQAPPSPVAVTTSKVSSNASKDEHIDHVVHLTPPGAGASGGTAAEARMHIKPRSSRGSGSNPPTTAAAAGAPGRLRYYKSNSTNKWVTREIAALEFLLGIPMEAERDIVHQGWSQQQGITEGRDQQSIDEEEEKVDVLEPPTENSSNAQRNNNMHQSASHRGRWWEKWINSSHLKDSNLSGRSGIDDEEELEQPGDIGGSPRGMTPSQLVPLVHAPGRRLGGDEATRVQIPLTVDSAVVTRQKNIARMAVTREWELQVAHGLGPTSTSSLTGRNRKENVNAQVHRPMLDGRLFFSAKGSYPAQVFSLLRYEPKKEEAARRRQKLEARGGGGTQFFIMPVRDWRGISYRALLPPRNSTRKNERFSSSLAFFDRFTTTPTSVESQQQSFAKSSGDDSGFDINESIDEVDEELESDCFEDEDTYVVGLLDDPGMVQGRHRNVMIGDRVTGPMVFSTIQFVKPELLKADLNKQFRERFDGWDPPKSQKKYIGARVVDGVYTLMEPGSTGDDGNVGTIEDDSAQPTTSTMATGNSSLTPRHRQGSMSSLSTGGTDTKETIRMPPSLTLSKIRSVKQQALVAAVKAKLEIGTVALAIVYFERLCLDCRVDKTNRRLSFAACMLLAIKINEAHVALMMRPEEEENLSKSSTSTRIQSLIRPTKKSSSMFASVLEFFTQEWNISLKHLFAAEWGVFAALQFRLQAKPSHVAFHFKRLLKSLGWNPRRYLGTEMYQQWQDELKREEYQRSEREARREVRQKRKEQKKLLHLERELEAAKRGGKNSSVSPRGGDEMGSQGRSFFLPLNDGKSQGEDKTSGFSGATSPRKNARKSAGIGGILNRFSGGKRALSSDKISEKLPHSEETEPAIQLASSPSMPALSGPFIAKSSSDDFFLDFTRPEGQSDHFIASDESVLGSDDGGIVV